MDKQLEKTIVQLAADLRDMALKMAFDTGNNGSHLGGGLSAIEIFATLYGSILNIDAKNPTNVNRDRLIVSKGHCVLAYYSTLNKMGFLSDNELNSFETNGAFLHGHATRDLNTRLKCARLPRDSPGLGYFHLQAWRKIYQEMRKTMQE